MKNLNKLFTLLTDILFFTGIDNQIFAQKSELIQHQKTMETMEVQVNKINTSHSSLPQIILNP